MHGLTNVDRALKGKKTGMYRLPQFRKEFAVPAGINWLGMVVRIDGVGDLKFKDVSLTEKK